MRPIIPRLILDNLARQRFSGQFQAVCVFVDTSGFTQMTEALMQYGQVGAETLTNLLQTIFTPLTQTIYRYGGFIASFTGDGFCALLLGDSPLIYQRAVAAGQEICQHMQMHPQHTTPYGIFTVALKVSLADGLVNWAIFPAESQQTLPYIYTFYGPAIDDAIEGEGATRAGHIGLSHPVYQRVAGVVEGLPTGAVVHVTGVRLNGALATPHARPKPMTRQPCFFSEVLYQMTTPGEFRPVVTVFINLRIPSLDDFLAICQPLIHQYGGYLARVARIGGADAGYTLLLFWGAPTSAESHVHQALNFMLHLRRAVPVASFRAGLTYNVAWAGFVGSDWRQEYTCYGLSVNLAARQMAAAGWGHIWLDETLVRQAQAVRAGKAFAVESLGRIAFKNVTSPQPVYQLLEAQPDEEKFFQGKLVGRKAEIEQLYAFSQQRFAAGQAGVAYVYGEAGIGKSHLAYALRQTLGEQVTWFTGQTDAILRQAFNPFVYWLRRYFQQWHDDDITGTHKARFMTQLKLIAKALPPPLQTELGRSRSFLGALLGLYWPNSVYERVDAKLRHENTVAGLGTLLVAESQQRPVVFELEDAHWLDDASQEVLVALSQSINRYNDSGIATPLLLLITSRYNDDGSKPTLPLSEAMHTHTTDLTPLSQADLHQQAEDVLAGQVDSSLAALLAVKTQGNPFFAQQLLYYFRENQLLTQTAHRTWLVPTTTQLNAINPIPSSVKAILIARIDRLESSVRRVVKTAAVLGREFEVMILSHMLGTNVIPAVLQAEQENIWSAVEDLTYVFRHTLMQETAYDMQLRTHLSELHYQAGVAYEAIYADTLTAHYPALAYHFSQAGDLDKAYHYARLAGQQAIDGAAYSDAVPHLSRALELAPDDTARFELLLLREKVCDRLGRRDAQADDLYRLQALGEHLGPESQALLALRQANHAKVMGNYEAGITAAQQAIAYAGTNHALVAAGFWTWGDVLYWQGNYDTAYTRLEHALQAAKTAVVTHPNAELSPRQVIADAFRSLGTVAWSQGDYDGARHYYDEALSTSRDIGDRFGEERTLNNLGLVMHDLLQYTEARQYYTEALSLSQDIGDRYGEGIALGNLGLLGLYQGDYGSTQDYCYQSYLISREIGDRNGEGIALSNLGILALHQKDYPAARQHLAQSLKISRDIGDRYGEGMALTQLGNLALGEGHLTEAEGYYQEAIVIHEALNQPQYLPDDWAGLAAVSLVRGDVAAAMQRIAPILTYLGDNPTLPGAWQPYRIFWTCFQVLQAADDARAKSVLEQAHLVLQIQAATMESYYRKMFLENVAEHRYIVTAWQQHHATHR